MCKSSFSVALHAGISKNSTNNNCYLCFKTEKFSFSVTHRPQDTHDHSGNFELHWSKVLLTKVVRYHSVTPNLFSCLFLSSNTLRKYMHLLHLIVHTCILLKVFNWFGFGFGFADGKDRTLQCKCPIVGI